MKAKSNRSITIETSRTVMYRQTSGQAQEWCAQCNSPGGSSIDSQMSTMDSWVTDQRLDSLHFDQTTVADEACVSEAESLSVISAGEDGLHVSPTRESDSAILSIAKSTQQNRDQGSLNDLLDWLNQDREIAGIRYEEIRRALIKLFVCRGAYASEDLADETIDRVVRKLPEIRENYQGKPIDYFCGVAKKIYLEYSRRNVPPVFVPSAKVETDEEVFNRLDRCLNRLTSKDRKLILDYYGGERKEKIDGRRELADKLGMPINALRIRAHRIRTSLLEMMTNEANR